MAAPSSIRVEANSISTTVLRWSYSGTHSIGIYRSPDNSVFTLIASVADTALTYTDTGLSSGTRYWYKVSDDDGATFSSTVNVVTHSCGDKASDGVGFGITRVSEAEIDELEAKHEINIALEEIESVLGRVISPNECVICPSNGAIIIDCMSGCTNFVIIADQDINSITVINCGEGDNGGGPGPGVDFIIPPNVTRQICGWPAGLGFSGDECNDAAIAGGSKGRTLGCEMGKTLGFGISCKDRDGYGKPKPGGGGGAGCTCVPGANGQLTIKCCTTDCSLDCDSAKSLSLIACGGKPPYAWTKTGGLVLSKTTGDRITVTPPTNSGSAVAGTAYVLAGGCVANAGGGCLCGTPPTTWIGYGCDDLEESACALGSAPACVTSPPDVCDRLASGGGCSLCGSGTLRAGEDRWCNCTLVDCLGAGDGPNCCAKVLSAGTRYDCRTAGMIASNCVPCGLEQGSTVTVTDDAGTAVSITVRAQ